MEKIKNMKDKRSNMNMNENQGKQKTVKFDLEKRQKSAFEAVVENVKMANEAVKSSQNWLLLLSLAEMSFLGMILLKKDNFWIIKVLIIILLVAFVLFILGSVLQYKHLLKRARVYEEISNKATEYLIRGIRFVNEIPKELKLPEKQIASNKCADYLISSSYILVILTTIGIIFLIIKYE